MVKKLGRLNNWREQERSVFLLNSITFESYINYFIFSTIIAIFINHTWTEWENLSVNLSGDIGNELRTSSKVKKFIKVSIFHFPSTSFLPLNQFGDFSRCQIERPLFLSLHLLPSFFHMELLTSLKAQSELDTYIIVQYSLVQYSLV